MTVEDKTFLRKMLADLSVFPSIDISDVDMARCFRLMIIKTLDELEPAQKRQPGGTAPKVKDDQV